MPAYAIVQEEINDQTMFDEYRKDVPEMIKRFGGRFLVRGGELTVLEGEWKLPRVVVIEFPTRADAEAWYYSPEYQAVIPLRLNSTNGNFIIVDGM